MKKLVIYTIGILLISMLFSDGVYSQSLTSPDRETTNSGQLSDQLKVFPNPSDGRFQMILEYAGMKKVAAKIFDITGKLVKDFSETLVINNSTVTADVDLSVPRSGIYFLRVEIGESAFTKKIIIR